MSSSLFRQTKLCDSLLDALDGLVQDNKIPPELGLKVLEKVRLTEDCSEHSHS